MSEPLLTRPQLAEMLGLSVRSIERLDRAGDGPGFVRVGSRAVRYDPAACRAWAASRSFPHRAAEVARASTPNETAG